MPSIPATAVSGELLAPLSPDIELCYQTFGSPEGDPLLLVMGLGGPMTWWDDEFCLALAARGFHVVRYDNRDTGRSSRVAQPVGRTTIVRAFLGHRVRAPYAMTDLAGDAVGLLDHLGIGAAHVVGVSMGGMIAQSLAIAAPHRVLSLTSISSTTGSRRVGWTHPALFPNLLVGRGPGREAYVEGSQAIWRRIGSPGFPVDLERAAERAGETWDRGVSASGVLRQMVAVLTQPDRTSALREVRVPTLVVHGRQDLMVHVSGGRATAAAVPDAELMLVDGLGHDLPPALFVTLTDAIRRTADRA